MGRTGFTPPAIATAGKKGKPPVHDLHSVPVAEQKGKQKEKD